MLPSSHDRPCKLLLMCHWLELFIERDEPGHEGAGFDLWQCIWGLKTPPPLGAPCVCARVCVCVCVRGECPFAEGIQQLPTNSEIALLFRSTPGWKKNWAGKSINQESCCHKRFLFFFFFFLLLMAREVFHHVPLIQLFFFFHHLALQLSIPSQTSQAKTGGPLLSVVPSMLVFMFFFAFHYFTPSISNEPLCYRPCSTTATINLLH